MGTHTKTAGRLDGPRRRLALRKLANQIRGEYLAYNAFSDQEAIDHYLELEMRSYRLDLAFHETAMLLGDETEADRPKMPSLLCRALEYESQSAPRAVYVAQLLMTTMESGELKQELDKAEVEVKRLQYMIDQLNPQHIIRRN